MKHPFPNLTVFSLLLSLVLTATTGPADSAPAPSPTTGSWLFQAQLNGKPIGQHRFTLVAQGSERKLTSEASFNVKFLGINAYRYRHQATETWRSDCLSGMAATTDDDGKPSTVRTEQRAEALIVNATNPKNPDGAAPLTLKGCVMSFAYWNPQIQAQTQLLNSQTGQYEAVQISRVGSGSVLVKGQPTDAVQWRITGPEAPIDVWYATQGGDWVGLDSTVAGGRKLSYRIQ
jgi:hypothetical protein